MYRSSYEEIARQIMSAERIVIFPHVHMDGDSLGSSAALCMTLRKLGKKADIFCCEPTPKALDFLEYGCVTRDPDQLGEIDLGLMVDCSSLSRIKWREDAFLSARVKGCIDHHGVTEKDVELDFGRIEDTSAATGEMIFLLIKELGCSLDLDITNALYAAISTDTGNFQYSNTTKRSHEIASTFYDVPGFDAKRVSALIYQRNSIGSLKLEGLMIDSINMYHDGKIAIGRVTEEMLKSAGALLNEAEGFVQTLLGIEGVEVACLLKDVEGRHVRVSLRAKEYANVANVANAIEGGGHKLAAGSIIHGSVDYAESVILPLIEKEI